jgi:hypothetical protein
MGGSMTDANMYVIRTIPEFSLANTSNLVRDRHSEES